MLSRRTQLLIIAERHLSLLLSDVLTQEQKDRQPGLAMLLAEIRVALKGIEAPEPNPCDCTTYCQFPGYPNSPPRLGSFCREKHVARDLLAAAQRLHPPKRRYAPGFWFWIGLGVIVGVIVGLLK